LANFPALVTDPINMRLEDGTIIGFSVKEVVGDPSDVEIQIKAGNKIYSITNDLIT
jgi:hypothetical protein